MEKWDFSELFEIGKSYAFISIFKKNNMVVCFYFLFLKDLLLRGIKLTRLTVVIFCNVYKYQITLHCIPETNITLHINFFKKKE